MEYRDKHKQIQNNQRVLDLSAFLQQYVN
jgi:hypothetical protein